jgi:hypothetical protein
MHVALDTWGMADICGTAVDLYVEHAVVVNDTVANNCVVFDVCVCAVSFKYILLQLMFISFLLSHLDQNSLS